MPNLLGGLFAILSVICIIQGIRKVDKPPAGNRGGENR